MQCSWTAARSNHWLYSSTLARSRIGFASWGMAGLAWLVHLVFKQLEPAFFSAHTHFLICSSKLARSALVLFSFELARSKTLHYLLQLTHSNLLICS